MNKWFILLVLIIVSISVNATYLQIGGDDSTFVEDNRGLFNELLTTVPSRDIDSRTLFNSKFIPLVANFNNNSFGLEVAVFDDNGIKIYRASDLNPISENSVTIDDYMTAQAMDYDNNGIVDIIALNPESEVLAVFEYYHWLPGWAVKNLTSLASYTHDTDAEMIFKCSDDKKCLILWSRKRDAGSLGSERELYVASYNLTSGTKSAEVLVDVVDTCGGTKDTSNFCFPKIPFIASEDYDTDGEIEFIFSYMDVCLQNGVDEDIFIRVFNISNQAGHIPQEEDYVEVTRPGNLLNEGVDGLDVCRTGHAGKYFTSPLVADLDDIPNNDLQIVIGHAHDEDEFKMTSYNSQLIEINDYPETFLADGEIISNVIKVNAFDTGMQDFCVVGYIGDSTLCESLNCTVNILCASLGEVGSVLGIPYFSDEWVDSGELLSLQDINEGYWNFTNMAHAVQTKSTAYRGSVDSEEILTSFGVLELGGGLPLTTREDLNVIWSNPKHTQYQQCINIPSQSDGEKFDIFCQVRNNIFRIDDHFVNQNAYIGNNSYIDPCTDQPWKLQIGNYTGDTYLTYSGETADALSFVTGENKVNTYLATWTNDGVKQKMDETVNGTKRRIDVRYNFTGFEHLEVDHLNITIEFKWNGDAGEHINMTLWNHLLNQWVYVYYFDGGTDATYNINNLAGHYVDENGVIRVRFSDSDRVDGTKDTIEIDYMVINARLVSEGTYPPLTDVLEIDLECIDNEGSEQVNGSVWIYKGTSNEQYDSKKGNSGTIFDFDDFYINKTITNGKIVFLCNDIYDGSHAGVYTSETNYNVTFDVQITGLEKGDCQDTFGSGDNPYDEIVAGDGQTETGDSCDDDIECVSGYCNQGVCTDLPDTEDNFITQAMKDFSFISGLPVAVLIFILLGIINWKIFTSSSIPGNAKLGGALVINLILIGLGVFVSLLNVIWIILFVLLIIGMVSVGIAIFIKGRTAGD